MKINLTKEYPYSADYFSYTVTTNPDGTTSNIFSTNPIQVKLSLSVNLLGELVMDSQSKLQINSLISNVLDRNGEAIYTNGVWEIIQTAPLLSAIGTKEGYRYRARLIAGQI